MSRKDVADALTKVLADTFVLYFKTHSFHWNVTGPRFHSLHTLFEEQYTELWEATDEIAERIRVLGEWAPNSYTDMIKSASLQETGQLPDANAMLEALANDNRSIVETLKACAEAAENIGDEATFDLMVQRTQTHEKAAWMLESSIDKAA